MRALIRRTAVIDKDELGGCSSEPIVISVVGKKGTYLPNDEDVACEIRAETLRRLRCGVLLFGRST